MEEARKKFGELRDDIREYIELQTNYYYLKLIAKISEVIAQSGIFITLTLAFLIFTLLLTFAFAFLLNEILDSGFLGFFIVSGIYLLFILILVWQKDRIKEAIMNAVIKGMLKDDDTTETDNQQNAGSK